MTNRLSWDKQVGRKNKREVLINTGKQNKHKEIEQTQGN